MATSGSDALKILNDLKNIVFNPFPIKKSHKKIIANFDSVCIRFVTFHFKNALAK